MQIQNSSQKNKVVDWFGENTINDTDSLDDEMEKSVKDRKEKKEKKIESKKIKKNIEGLKKENKKSVNE